MIQIKVLILSLQLCLDFVNLAIIKLGEQEQNNLYLEKKFLVAFLFGFFFRLLGMFLTDVLMHAQDIIEE